MNEHNHDLARAVAQAERDLAAMSPLELKKLRKAVRKILRKDLQRRAITGEPRGLLGRAV